MHNGILYLAGQSLKELMLPIIGSELIVNLIMTLICIMFDLNNLKKANDTLGHSVGDQLILNFAKLLRNVVPSKDFVGRYGGDEFIAVIYNSTKDEVTEILNRLDNEISEFNELGKAFKISYAHGCAFSSDYKDCTLRTRVDKADKYLYDNKQAEKAGR